MASLKAASRLTSKRVIYASIAGDFLIGATKFAAAYVTGSSAMLSEGMHSIVDTGNGFLVLHGLHRGSRRPDREHPLGYGREIWRGSCGTSAPTIRGRRKARHSSSPLA